MSMTSSRMNEVAKAQSTIASKVRALAREGATRREIADHLGRSYQQVRQVLVEDERRRGPRPNPSPEDQASRPEGSQSAGPADGLASGTVRLVVDGNWGLRLPDDLARQAGLVPGGVAMARIVDGDLVLSSADRAMRKAQDLVRSRISGTVRLADELLADRRRDARE